MKTPATPENETERLNSLRESGLLEIDSSPAFDRLTRLAKRFFQVPLAMVNLIDEHSLIVKSADGQAPDSVPRNISFCGHTILSEAPLVVGDMRQDDRFADNPLVAGEPGVRFYAGFPLRLRDGASVGSLCLIDYSPREFTAADLAVLGDLGALAEDEFAAVSAATTDELTGLFNRRGFNQLVRFTLSVARRRAEPLTLGWLDLDRFKEINDRYGHEEGDKALNVMAQLMRSSFVRRICWFALAGMSLPCCSPIRMSRGPGLRCSIWPSRSKIIMPANCIRGRFCSRGASVNSTTMVMTCNSG